MKKVRFIAVLLLCCLGCKEQRKTNLGQSTTPVPVPFFWEAANVYFLLTDRFHNGDTLNDVNYERIQKAAPLRGFKGGDLKGVTAKIKEGYFTDLGVNAIWMTPITEQIHGATNEGTGVTYGFHGYWTKDWTAIDANFGTKTDLHELVEEAHRRGIKIVLDAVVNHTGPVTAKDPLWPDGWVRTQPQCTYTSYDSTINCTLVKNLPDIKTESETDVALPPHLIEKWKAEGRYAAEMQELDAFFERTGYPRAPKYYIIKWLTDYIVEFGIDGYRVDTVKHTEAKVWQDFRTQCDYAFEQYKTYHNVKTTTPFYLVGEVYNYGISSAQWFDFGDKKVNYFDNAFHSLINFEMKSNAAVLSYERLFKRYDSILNHGLKAFSVLNYMSSHDDGQPFDALRQKPFETATKLLLTPGASQIYYGDESARVLVAEGAVGDANLRSVMNWEAIFKNDSTKALLRHWQKLGQFRAKHPAIGAGAHQMLTKVPYVFSRDFEKETYNDRVVVGLDVNLGKKILKVSPVFKDGTVLYDAYSRTYATVSKGYVTIASGFNMVLLEKR